MKLKLGLLLFLCPIFGAFGQNYTNTTLKIGDKVPDMVVGQVINYPLNSLPISDFKGRLLILDFWATWCSSCLAHFPLADSLQKEFRNDVQILLVDALNTKDTREKALKTIQRFDQPGNSAFSLPSAVNDTLLDRMFPHFTIPHYVWIDRDGIVRAVTSAEELTRENIIRFLKQNQTPLYQKDDYDPQRPLYTVKNLPLDHLQQFSILLKGKIDGIGNGGMRVINDTTRGIILHDRSLLSMYQSILYAKIPGVDENRLIIEVKDPSKLSYSFSKQKKQDWERENIYSYELIVPANEMGHLYDDVLDDLNKYTPYTAHIEKRKTFCWILEKTGKTDLIHTKGRKYTDALDDSSHARLINSTLFNLCIYLNKITSNAVILDQTGYTWNVDLEFKGPVKDITAMKKELKPYGLKLFAAYRKVDMLVIKDK